MYIFKKWFRFSKNEGEFKKFTVDIEYSLGGAVTDAIILVSSKLAEEMTGEVRKKLLETDNFERLMNEIRFNLAKDFINK